MRESELTQFYIDQMLALLATPLGMAGLIALLALIAAVVTVPWMRWVCLTGLIYISTIPLTEGGNIKYVPLAPPLEQFRSFGRPLIYLSLALLLIPLALSQRRLAQATDRGADPRLLRVRNPDLTSPDRLSELRPRRPGHRFARHYPADHRLRRFPLAAVDGRRLQIRLEPRPGGRPGGARDELPTGGQPCADPVGQPPHRRDR
ncbi:MAG: hypothetical protein QM754_02940 [Tepidisphaeraceae bacterium]